MIEKSISYKYKVYEKIKEDIIIGVYSQGEVLNERKLAETMGVSRTPIREALQLLNSDGWVVNEPYKGTVVRTFDVDYVMNAQKVRRVLEISAIEEAMNNIDDEDIKELTAVLRKQEECLNNYNPTEFMKLDREFHEKIYYLSKNDILFDLLQNFNDIIRFYGIKVLLVPERNKTTLIEHLNILDAIKERNVYLAKEAMDHHLLMTGKAIHKYTIGTNE
ncbi:DNA-binding transcriptional regulator, GntR family [Anaerovirgula multivorans]|uniref:DNA-binding transcriptional regulator, GntR family n=1 Tax=Anaerovirgula multivorans TaxID=312168 RepID=A0A239LCP2_9FIRM|nr:GntR family transcriptional regulator [Anaerovirgula multivorans]SNT27294.1 DNA-binding transcriptional regulator, GntR family [Anaerovirgula multivorans]